MKQKFALIEENKKKTEQMLKQQGTDLNQFLDSLKEKKFVHKKKKKGKKEEDKEEEKEKEKEEEQRWK